MNTRSVLVLVGLTGVLGGCPGLIAPGARSVEPVVTVKPLGTAPGGAVAAGEVQLYRSAQDLPAGFYFARNAAGQVKLYASPAYPTADQPNLVIAGMAAAPPEGSTGWLNPKDIEAAFRAKAGELGGNGLFVGTGDARIGYVIHVSPAAAVSETEKPDKLLAQAAREQVGFEPDGKPTRHEMAGAEPVTFAARRGDCYLIAFALDTDGVLAPRAETGILIESHSGDELMSNRTTMPIEAIGDVDGFELRAPANGRYLHLRSGALSLGCAWAASQVSVVIYGAGRSPLGQGHYLTRVYRKHISNGELARKKKENDQAVAQAEADAERFRQEEAQRERQREAERQQREAEERQREAARGSAGSGGGGGGGGGGSAYYSFSMKNECSHTVKLKITSSTGNPKFSGGTETSIGANTIQSYSGTGPTYFWILDDSGEGVSSFTASAGQRDVRITPSCGGFAPR